MTKLLLVIAIILGIALMILFVGILPTIMIILFGSIFYLLAGIVIFGTNQLWDLMLLTIIGLELIIAAIIVLVVYIKS